MKILIVLILLFVSRNGISQSSGQVYERINSYADSTSLIDKYLSYLSDVYGPRLMGTPQYYKSAQWIVQEIKRWSVDNVYFEPFDQNYIGWSVKEFDLQMIEPTQTHLNAYPLAYTRSTQNDRIGTPTVINSFDQIYELEGNLNDKIIFLSEYYRPVSNVESAMSTRLDEQILNRAASNPDPNDVLIGYHSRRSTVDVFGRRARIKKQRTEFFKFCEEQGVIAVIEPSNFPYGILHADGNRSTPSFSRKEDYKPIASFVMSNEHFGRIIRLIDLAIEPRIKVNLETVFYDEQSYNVNVVAEIEGSDERLKEEVVIIGAHLDSWHAGTGAVDNASNCAVMMEALRILHGTGLKPKRTIRMILWGGEEQIFAGSKNYVSDNIGNFATGQTKEGGKIISTYLNLDNGAGKIRGVYLNGNDAVIPYFSEYLEPFENSQTLTLQNANQTDHELFDYFNIPAFQFIQDPLDYMSAIHHTNMDVYEYVPIEDQKYNAKLIAYLSYKIAEEDKLLPRREHISPIASRTGNTKFELEGYKEASNVYVVGNFNNWNMFGTPMHKTDNGWECKLDLPGGRYYYKFIVDGHWTSDPSTKESELLKDGKGHGGVTLLIVDQ